MEEIKDTPKENKEEATASDKKSKKEKLTELTDRVTELESEVKKLEAEAKEKDDKYLRLAAEYDNFRRRSREEKDGIYENALADTVKELLPILDNLERATAVGGADAVNEGLSMINKSVGEVLTSLGVEKFGEVGDTFDPNLHNAVMHEDNEELGEGVITDVFQKGYKKGKKIIRFAMVKTAN